MGRCVFQSLCGILDALIGFCLFVVICEDPGTLFLQESLLIQDLFELTAIGGRIICGLFQQCLELLLQFSQPAFNISKAHRTTGEWDDLRFHGIRDLPNQAILVGHGCVQGCENCLLERRFIQCGRIVAVFLAVIQSAHTAPHDSFFTVSRPCAAAIQGPALTADQPL